MVDLPQSNNDSVLVVGQDHTLEVFNCDIWE